MRTAEFSAFSRRFSLQPRAALFWCLVLACVLADRWLWVSVSQRGEDEGTNLWLGYTSWLHHAVPPVGLLSSKHVPNPNGMPLLSMLFTLLPSLFSVSLACSLVQVGAILWASHELSRGARWVRLCLALPPLACVVLRAASVELWNQWLFIAINALVVALVARELRKHHPFHYVAISWLILLAPALYLMGVLNALLFALALLALVIHQFRSIQWRSRATLVCLGVIALSVGFCVWITWLPYLHTLPLSKLTELQSAPFSERARTAWQAIWQARKWLFKVHPEDLSPIFQSDENINGRAVQRYAKLAARVFKAQLWIAAFALLVASIGAVRHRRSPLRLTPVWLLAGVVLAFAGSPLLGGFELHSGERTDQSMTFLVWVFWMAYSVPLLGRALGKLRRAITIASVCTAFAYTGIGLLRSLRRARTLAVPRRDLVRGRRPTHAQRSRARVHRPRLARALAERQRPALLRHRRRPRLDPAARRAHAEIPP